MKYYTRLRLFKASNVVFNPRDMTAHSYRHWKFMGRLPNGEIVFSIYRYSNSTSKHQSKVLRTLERNYDMPTHMWHMPDGVDRPESAIAWYEHEVDSLYKAMDKKGSRKATNMRRAELICSHITAILKIRQVYDLAADARIVDKFDDGVHKSLLILVS